MRATARRGSRLDSHCPNFVSSQLYLAPPDGVRTISCTNRPAGRPAFAPTQPRGESVSTVQELAGGRQRRWSLKNRAMTLKASRASGTRTS